MMKWLLNIVGVILVLIGIVWFFQGINVLLGSFMSGNSSYAFLGGLLVLAGSIILIFNYRSRKSDKDKE
ncbi:MAG: hypothetical protein WA997_10060 [Anaerolineales bacterium]